MLVAGGMDYEVERNLPEYIISNHRSGLHRQLILVTLGSTGVKLEETGLLLIAA